MKSQFQFAEMLQNLESGENKRILYTKNIKEIMKNNYLIKKH